MHHELDLLGAEELFDCRLIAKGQLMEGDLGRERGAVAVDKVVQHHGAVPGGDELADAMAADVTGAPDDKHVHAVRLVLLSAGGWLAISFPNE